MTKSLSQEIPPESFEPDQRDYLSRRFIDIDVSLDDAQHANPPRKQMPYKPQFGHVYYFGDPSTHQYDPAITAEGWWGYKELVPQTDPPTGEWVKLNSQQDTWDWQNAHLDVNADPHPQYNIEAYGGLLKETDTNYGTVGSGAWTTIDNWDSGMVPIPKGIIQDIGNSGLIIVEEGIYSLVGNIAVSFTDTNQGRIFGVRLFNLNDGTPGRTIEYFVGRNQDGVNISQGALLRLFTADDLGDVLQLQIAGIGDSFANVAVIDALFSITRVG